MAGSRNRYPRHLPSQPTVRNPLMVGTVTIRWSHISLLLTSGLLLSVNDPPIGQSIKRRRRGIDWPMLGRVNLQVTWKFWFQIGDVLFESPDQNFKPATTRNHQDVFMPLPSFYNDKKCCLEARKSSFIWPDKTEISGP